MKAKTYYDKYKDAIKKEYYFNSTRTDPSVRLALSAQTALFNEMFQELTAMAEKRQIKRWSALKAAIHEMNDRWNAVNRCFIARDRISPLTEDMFGMVVIDRLSRKVEEEKEKKRNEEQAVVSQQEN